MSSNSMVMTPSDPTSNRRPGSRTMGVKLATGCSMMGDRVCYRKYATGKQRNSKQTMHKICTWNVRGLKKAGKLTIVERAIGTTSITGLSETHWKHSGHFTSANGNLVISSGNEARAANGVGFIIHKNIKESVLGYEAVSDNRY